MILSTALDTKPPVLNNKCVLSYIYIGSPAPLGLSLAE